MTSTEALITIARRYCMEHYHYWAVRYSKERTGQDYPAYSYSDNDYDLFPRYNILAAILGEIEILAFAGEELLVFIKHLFAGRESLLHPLIAFLASINPIKLYLTIKKNNH